MEDQSQRQENSDEIALSIFSSSDSDVMNHQCFLCYRHCNFTVNEKLLTVSKDSVYKSCCHHIRKEYLKEDFFSWNENAPLPFCKKCINNVQKLSRMNNKLEEIKNLIIKFVDAFTVDFLNDRDRSTRGKVLYDYDITANSVDESPEELQTVKLETVDDCDILEESVDYLSNDPLDNFSSYGSAEDGDVPLPEVKQELFLTPVSAGLRGRKKKSVSNTKAQQLSKPRRGRKNGTRVEQKISKVNRRKSKLDDDGNPIPDALPRRKAAMKAEATILAWNDNAIDENTRESFYDDQNEETHEDSTISLAELDEPFEKQPKLETSRKYKKRQIAFMKRKATLTKYNSSERRFKCKECDKSYKNRHHLLEHELTHDETRRFQCTMCDMSYSYVRNLRKHILKHGPDGSYVSSKRKTGEKKSKRESGALKTRTYFCKACDKVCNTASQLFYHSQIHKTDQGEFKCETCHKVFKNAVTFQKHGRIHTGENKFLCSICGKEFKSRSGQKDHEWIHKADSEQLERKSFECPICHKMYASKSSLNKHSFRHNEEKLFVCTLCNKRFATKAGLATHGIYHKGERPFLCEECGKSFFTKTKLKEHNRIHTGMLFPCEYCEKGFQTTTHLKQHYRSHEKKMNAVSNVKPDQEQPQLIFQCSACEQFFESQSSLNNHVITHTDHIPCYLNYDQPDNQKFSETLNHIVSGNNGLNTGEGELGDYKQELIVSHTNVS